MRKVDSASTRSHGGEDYFVYGLMDSLRPYSGTLPVQRFKLGTSGSNTKVGDMELQPAFQLTGKVVLPSDAQIPPNTFILIERDDAWDTQQTVLASDGSFGVSRSAP